MPGIDMRRHERIEAEAANAEEARAAARDLEQRMKVLEASLEALEDAVFGKIDWDAE